MDYKVKRVFDLRGRHDKRHLSLLRKSIVSTNNVCGSSLRGCPDQRNLASGLILKFVQTLLLTGGEIKEKERKKGRKKERKKKKIIIISV